MSADEAAAQQLQRDRRELAERLGVIRDCECSAGPDCAACDGTTRRMPSLGELMDDLAAALRTASRRPTEEAPQLVRAAVRDLVLRMDEPGEWDTYGAALALLASLRFP